MTTPKKPFRPGNRPGGFGPRPERRPPAPGSNRPEGRPQSRPEGRTERGGDRRFGQNEFRRPPSGRGPRPDRPANRPEGRPSGRPPGRFREEAEARARPHLGKDEVRYYGKNACLALWKHRPKDVIRVYVRQDLSDQFAELLSFCAEQRRSYHLVDAGDLERLTDTMHHEGICVVAREKRFLNENDFFREVGGGRNLVLFLDGVGNPHNLGAILRTAAHFGVRYVAGADESLPRISASANRTSEGGAESVSLVRVQDPERFLDRIRGLGFHVYAFDPGEKAKSIFETRLSERAVFVMGAEVTGVSGLMRELSEMLVKIPGTGAVESLNVSVAAALAMAEFRRQEIQAGTVRIVKTPPRG